MLIWDRGVVMEEVIFKKNYLDDVFIVKYVYNEVLAMGNFIS